MMNQDDNNKKFTIRKTLTSKKKKRILMKEQQAMKLRLDQNILKNQHLLNKKLLQFIKNSKSYKRYCTASYTFSYRKLLYKNYCYLLNLKRADRVHILFKNNKKHFMNSVSVKKLNQLYSNVFNSKD